ncbi:MAG: hypothetical protein AB7Q27_27560, partial [Acidimicrobiia bacterium]
DHTVRIDSAHGEDGDFEILACPFCDGNWLHFDEVQVGGRSQEDAAFANVLVEDSGRVRQNLLDSEMASRC